MISNYTKNHVAEIFLPRWLHAELSPVAVTSYSDVERNEMVFRFELPDLVPNLRRQVATLSEAKLLAAPRADPASAMEYCLLPFVRQVKTERETRAWATCDP